MADAPSQDAPPSYEAATGSAAKHETSTGITREQRRSMEDEHRALPDGWVRQYDSTSSHQFFVDTRSDPPRSIWHHPYDDEDYMSSLSPKERESINREHKSSLSGKGGEHSDEEGHAGPSSAQPRPGAVTGASSASAPATDNPTGIHKFGRRLKDKVTSTTHEQREADRRQRMEQEREAYEAHRKMRIAMQRAMETGQPQFLAKDRNGRDVYIEPPQGPRAPPGAQGYNPYNSGPYANPNARFVRPQYDYYRPYGYGYGGGLGLPIAGGLLGGALLGAALF